MAAQPRYSPSRLAFIPHDQRLNVPGPCAGTSKRLQPQALHSKACNRGAREGGEEIKMIRRSPANGGMPSFRRPDQMGTADTAASRGIRNTLQAVADLIRPEALEADQGFVEALEFLGRDLPDLLHGAKLAVI